MRKIGKTLAVIAAVAGIGSAGVALAQPSGMGGGPMGFGTGFMRGYGGNGMMGGWGGHFDPAARLDALKIELGIRPEQQAAWDGYVKALQDSATQVQAMRNAMFQAMGAANWQEHQAQMAKLFDQRAQAFKTVQDAATKLMAVLDDSQKARVVLPGLTGSGPGAAMGGGGPGWMGCGGMMGWSPGGGAR